MSYLFGRRSIQSNWDNGSVLLNNGAVYHGQWVGEVKEGYGVQVWPDGAKYEGHWKANMACGKGKFTHADGDVFDGYWKNDKANG